MDIICCVKGPSREFETESEGIIYRFIKNIYSPILFSKVIRALVIPVFVGWLCISIADLPHLKVGLEQDLSMPEDSFVLKYFEVSIRILCIAIDVSPFRSVSMLHQHTIQAIFYIDGECPSCPIHCQVSFPYVLLLMEILLVTISFFLKLKTSKPSKTSLITVSLMADLLLLFLEHYYRVLVLYLYDTQLKVFELL